MLSFGDRHPCRTRIQSLRCGRCRKASLRSTRTIHQHEYAELIKKHTLRLRFLHSRQALEIRRARSMEGRRGPGEEDEEGTSVVAVVFPLDFCCDEDSRRGRRGMCETDIGCAEEGDMPSSSSGAASSSVWWVDGPPATASSPSENLLGVEEDVEASMRRSFGSRLSRRVS